MTNPDLNRPVGVWRAIGELKFKDAAWPEGCIALALGGGGAALVVRETSLNDRLSTMGDVLTLGGALLAVIFAALAIVVSLPSTSYLRMLEETPEGGMRRFLDPFLVAVGVQASIVLLAISYSLVAESVAWWIEHAAFYVAGVLVVFGLLDVVALARQLVRHGVLRAVDATLVEEGKDSDERKVSRLPERRG